MINYLPINYKDMFCKTCGKSMYKGGFKQIAPPSGWVSGEWSNVGREMSPIAIRTTWYPNLGFGGGYGLIAERDIFDIPENAPSIETIKVKCRCHIGLTPIELEKLYAGI